jgi:hypothetical protein
MKHMLIAAGMVVLLLPGSLGAHHAAAGVDQSTTVTIEGAVTQFRWANPHSWLEMEVINEEGEAELWNLEMLPPSYLIPAGWTRNTVKAGDEVTVVARPMLSGAPGGLFVSVTLADGTELGGRGGRGGGRGAGARGGN